MLIHTNHSLQVMHSARVDSLAASATNARRRARSVDDGPSPGRGSPGPLGILARGFRRLPILGGRSRVQGYGSPQPLAGQPAPEQPVRAYRDAA
jgi:hypothetical protein